MMGTLVVKWLTSVTWLNSSLFGQSLFFKISLLVWDKDERGVLKFSFFYNELFCVCIYEEGGKVCTNMYGCVFTVRES